MPCVAVEMKEIRIYLENTGLRSSELSVKLHGYLMSLVGEDYATLLHQQDINPYSLYVTNKKDHQLWVVTLLTVEAEKRIGDKLLALRAVEVKSQQTPNPIPVLQIDSRPLDLEERVSVLKDREASQVKIHLRTTTGFKSQGNYVLFPSTRLLFQSLLRKQAYLLEGKTSIDMELLDQLVQHSRLVAYDLKSSFHYVHRQKLPGFYGQLTLQLTGDATLKEVAYRLLSLGELAGLGMKTSLGMGRMQVETPSPSPSGAKSAR